MILHNQFLLLSLLAASSALPWSGRNGTNINSTGLINPSIHNSKGGASTCTSGYLEISASTTTNRKFNFSLPSTQTEVTQAILNQWTTDSTFLADITIGNQNVSGTYKIGVTYCLPEKKTSTIQVLTHGIGFDRYYWDFAPGYSYVDIAVAAGYAVVLYDRLGVGLSSTPDPLNTVQSPLEVEILHALTDTVRAGRFGTFANVVGVGHSFGSAITQGMTAAYPEGFDAVVLTDFSTNITGMPAFSLGQNPVIASTNDPRFSALNNGYLVLDTQTSVQQTFFHAPGFDPEILALSAATKATVTLGEYFTTGAVVKPVNLFHGPAIAAAGNEDLGFCFGNCSYPTNILAETLATLYPNASKTMTFLAEDAGHGLNLHYSAAQVLQSIQSFFKDNGL